jgi:hypothetical protein
MFKASSFYSIFDSKVDRFGRVKENMEHLILSFVQGPIREGTRQSKKASALCHKECNPNFFSGTFMQIRYMSGLGRALKLNEGRLRMTD